MEVVTIGLDISKHVFHVHAVDTQAQVTSRQRLRCGRSFPSFCTLSPCLVGSRLAPPPITGRARSSGFDMNDVRLIPPASVKPYVRREQRTMPPMRPQSVRQLAAQYEVCSHQKRREPRILDASSCKRFAGPPENHDRPRYSSSLCGVGNHCRTKRATGGLSSGFVG
jgi:hypothetical protein